MEPKTALELADEIWSNRKGRLEEFLESRLTPEDYRDARLQLKYLLDAHGDFLEIHFEGKD
jgi:hypothetical protein